MQSAKKKSFLVIGGGRWAKIYIEELLKLNSKVTVITSNKDLKNNLNNINLVNLKIVKKFDNVKIAKHHLIILCNKTEKRLNFLKKINKLKNQILVEKPFTNNPNNYFEYKFYNKNNIFLGLQFYFSTYFLILKRIIKKEKIKKINLDWFDNQNEKKIFNKNINFIEDAYYHFFSIIRVFLNTKKLINKLSKIGKNRIVIYKNNVKIILNASKNSNLKKRILKIETNKYKYSINFKNLDEVIIKKNNEKKIITRQIRNLPIQIKNFANNKKEIKKNSLKNLKPLFDDLVRIKYELSKK